MSEIKCKHSVYIEEICETSDICSMAVLLTPCEGLRADSRNCHFWKRGDGEP